MNQDGLCSSVFISRSSDEAGTVGQAEATVLDALDDRMGVMPIIAPHTKRAEEEVSALRAQVQKLKESVEQQNGPRRHAIFVEGKSDFLVVKRILKCINPSFGKYVNVMEPPARAGAGYVANMLRAWECLSRHEEVGLRKKAYGIFDGDPEGKEAAKRFSADYPSARYAVASVLAIPPHLVSAAQMGVGLNITLEEQYCVDWWNYAFGQGWLGPRDRSTALSDGLKKKIIDGGESWGSLTDGADWAVIANNCAGSDHKVDWANWISARSDTEIQEGLAHLIEFLKKKLELDKHIPQVEEAA